MCVYKSHAICDYEHRRQIPRKYHTDWESKDLNYTSPFHLGKICVITYIQTKPTESTCNAKHVDKTFPCAPQLGEWCTGLREQWISAKLILSLVCDLHPQRVVRENSDSLAWLFHKARFIFSGKQIILYEDLLPAKPKCLYFFFDSLPDQAKHIKCTSILWGSNGFVVLAISLLQCF